MTPTFLFRHPRAGHVFITTEDPSYRYDTLCGHCDFPIEPDEESCPRCQRQLEDCPVCRFREHRRSPVDHRSEQPHVAHCAVCHVTRHPTGWTSLRSLSGSFCTNLYGCPAGGLLLSNEELAVLPNNASACPVCRHEKLAPLAITGFHYLVRHCLFCSTLFGYGATWSRGWSTQPVAALSSEWIAEGGETCRLCGRNDRLKSSPSDGVRSVICEAVTEHFQTGAEANSGLSVPAYLRMVELARALALNADRDADAFSALVRLWFDTTGEVPGESGGVSVRRLIDALVRGTLDPVPRALLQGRIDSFERAWERNLGVGLGYRVAWLDGADDQREP